jgi:hypothetical protein
MSLRKQLGTEKLAMPVEECLASEFAERRWVEEGRPTTRWALAELLRSVVCDCDRSVLSDPPVLAGRLRDLERGTFKLPISDAPN